MTQATLIDMQAANIEAREALRRDVTRQAMELCGATKGTNAFLLAVEHYQDAIAEIERKGYCLACGGTLVSETQCVKCGRDNQ